MKVIKSDAPVIIQHTETKKHAVTLNVKKYQFTCSTKTVDYKTRGITKLRPLNTVYWYFNRSYGRPLYNWFDL